MVSRNFSKQNFTTEAELQTVQRLLTTPNLKSDKDLLHVKKPSNFFRGGKTISIEKKTNNTLISRIDEESSGDERGEMIK